jgi:aminopeptidase N
MTDQLAVLAAVAVNPSEARDTALAEFYDRWKGDGLVIDKWLGFQAASSMPGGATADCSLLLFRHIIRGCTVVVSKV